MFSPQCSRSFQVDQELKTPSFTPAVVGKVAVESENFSRIQFVREMNQASICEVRWLV